MDITQSAQYIVFDGQDGSGKGTQMKLFSDRAEAEGRKFIQVREPGGTLFGEDLRKILMSCHIEVGTEFFCMMAARNELMRQVVMPHLEKGISVISDRGDSSTYAYQICGRRASYLEDEFWRMRELFFSKCTPNHYLIFDLSSEEAQRRSNSDPGHNSVFDKEKLEFYKKVALGYRSFVYDLPRPGKGTIIDAGRSPEIIHEEVYGLISGLCGWE
ncbi:MAG: dTMP kinase [Patescibacteria group bacterium]